MYKNVTNTNKNPQDTPKLACSHHKYIDEILGHFTNARCHVGPCSPLPTWVLSVLFLLSWMHFLCPRQVLLYSCPCSSSHTTHYKGVYVSAERRGVRGGKKKEEKVYSDNTGAVQSVSCRSKFSRQTKRRVLDFPVTLTSIVKVRKLTRPADMIRCSQPWKQQTTLCGLLL